MMYFFFFLQDPFSPQAIRAFLKNEYSFIHLSQLWRASLYLIREVVENVLLRSLRCGHVATVSRLPAARQFYKLNALVLTILLWLFFVTVEL